MCTFMLAMYVAMANGVHVPVGIQVVAWILTIVSLIAALAKACLGD